MSHESPTPSADAAVAEPAVPAPDRRPRAIARFQAKVLHALAPIIRESQESYARPMTRGLIIEPHADGGVVLIATNGSIMAAIHDPTGRATRPMRIHVDDRTLAAVRPPAPVTMWSEGESFPIPLPEWAHPGVVMAIEAGIVVFAGMHLPGIAPEVSPALSHTDAEYGNVHDGGYRIHDEAPAIPWRAMLVRPRFGGDGHTILLPDAIATFAGIQNLYGIGLQFDAAGRGDPIIISAPGHPEFIGAVMQAKGELTDDPVPAWARH